MHLVIAPPVSGIARQRISKVGTWGSSFTGLKQCTGWTPDAAAPGVVASDGLQVAGGGDVMVSISLLRSGSTHSVLQIRRNADIIWSTTYPQEKPIVASVPISVVDGDLISIWAQNNGSGSNVTDGSWVEVAPA